MYVRASLLQKVSGGIGWHNWFCIILGYVLHGQYRGGIEWGKTQCRYMHGTERNIDWMGWSYVYTIYTI